MTPTRKCPGLIDASEAANAQQWVSITYRQLSAGQFSGRLESIDLDGIGLFHERHDQDVNKSGALPPEKCTVSFIDHCDERARFSQFIIDGTDVAFFQPAGDEFDILVPAGRGTTYMYFNQEELIAKLSVLNAQRADQLSSYRCVQSLGMKTRLPLERVMNTALAMQRNRLGGQSSAIASHMLQRNVMEQIVLILAVSGDTLSGCAPRLHGRRRAWRIVRAAREFMEEQLYQGVVPTMIDLCAHTGVAERTLRYAFRDQLGCSPKVYLQMIRLNGVRVELLSAESKTTSVTAAATRWGFMHLGRFAQDYRALFGELPSTTLAHALRRVSSVDSL